MAVATATAITSAGIGLFQAGKGMVDANNTRKEIENFNRQELVNPYENISVSTLKSDQQTDANLSNVATSVDALQRGGTRAVLGGIPRINESNILLQGLISQDLEQQDINRDLLIAKGEEDIRGIRESREINALAGLGQQLQTARQDTSSGITNAVSSGLSIPSALKFDKENPDLQLFGKK